MRLFVPFRDGFGGVEVFRGLAPPAVMYLPVGEGAYTDGPNVQENSQSSQKFETTVDGDGNDDGRRVLQLSRVVIPAPREFLAFNFTVTRAHTTEFW